MEQHFQTLRAGSHSAFVKCCRCSCTALVYARSKYQEQSLTDHSCELLYLPIVPADRLLTSSCDQVTISSVRSLLSCCHGPHRVTCHACVLLLLFSPGASFPLLVCVYACVLVTWFPWDTRSEVCFPAMRPASPEGQSHSPAADQPHRELFN